MRAFVLFAAIMGAALSSAAQQASTCQPVYQDSVRNVDVNSRVLSERSELFTKHCEANGSMKSSSTALDLTVPIKTVQVGFSGSRDEAQQKMQQFCKSHSEALSRYENVYQYSNSVVVDALRSYNQCLVLEGKGVRISHLATDARSLVVRVDLNPATSNVTLNSVQYDTAVATCTSNIYGRGTPKTVNATSGQVTAKGPFSVACERKAALTAEGARKFPRVELLVDTNQGAYTVALPTEEMLGYDLASANKRTALVGAQERADLHSELAALKGTKADVQFVTQGEGNTVACPQRGGSSETYARGVCTGGKVSDLKPVYSHGGGECGHTTFAWLCTKP
jgi:hypothetical protein